MSADWRWQCTDRHLCVEWPQVRTFLSSAVLNGGLVQARRVFNLRVAGTDTDQPPETALREYAAAAGWHGDSVGLMTAASMRSLRTARAEVEGGVLEVLLTCGLSNARRAGDRADWSEWGQSEWEERSKIRAASPPAGTINTILLCSHRLQPAAMAELLTLVTEAKCAALQELRVLSPISGGVATGTGTDAAVIVGGRGRALRWCGKHTLLGQVAATLVMQTLHASVGTVREPARHD